MSQNFAELSARKEKARGKVEQVRQTIIADKERLSDTSMTAFAARNPRLAMPALKQRRTLKGHLNKVTSVSWSADSSQVLSASQDGKLIIWEAQSTNKLQAITLQSSWVMTCAMSPTGRLVASGGLDNICSVYNIKSVEVAMSQAPNAIPLPTKSLDAHVGFVSGIKFLSDAQLLTSSGDQTCGLWDVETGRMTLQFLGHNKDVMGLSVLRDSLSGQSNTFVSASGDNTARLWDIRSGRCEAMFSTGEDESDLIAIDAFPNSHAFATGGEDGVVRLFDIRAEQMLQSYLPAGEEQVSKKDRKNVTSLAFTSSGRALVVGYEEESMRIWDTFRGEQVGLIKAHDDRVSCLAVSPDGNGLATGSWDNLIKIWA